MTKKGKHTVLFICLGNICRSPAAEGIMKSLVEKAFPTAPQTGILP